MTTATIDDEKRVRIPDAKPGQVVSIEPGPNGGWQLLPVKVAEAEDPFPPGSLLKYFTPAKNAEEMEIFKALGGVVEPEE